MKEREMKKSEIKKVFNAFTANKTIKKTLLIASCVLIAFLLIMLISLLFPIKKFEVEGSTRYDINELIDASGIRTGDRLYALNRGKAEKKLMEGCPYVKSVKIKRVFPNKVCFVIEERVAGWYVQVGEDFYALDYDLKVLLESFDESDMIARGLTKLVLPELESVVAGELPSFGGGDEHLMSETLKIIDTVRTHKIKERLTLLDLSNRFQIEMVVDGSYSVDFGDMDDAKTKFDMIDQIISTAAIKGYVGGVISVVNPSEHTFRGIYPDEAETDGAENSDE